MDWQDGQRHSLTDRSNSFSTCPQFEQVLDEGYHWSMNTTCFPFFVATHSRIWRNSPNAKSEIFRPHKHCIPLRFNVSKHNTSKWVVKSCANFQNQSERRLTTSSCLRTRFNLARSRVRWTFPFLGVPTTGFLYDIEWLFEELRWFNFGILWTGEKRFQAKIKPSDSTHLEFGFWFNNAIYHDDHKQLS